MTCIEELAALYEEYITVMRQLDQERQNLRGALQNILGGGMRPGSDSCNDRFSEGLSCCLNRFLESKPSAQAVNEVLRYVLEQGRQRQDGGSAAMMLEAVHGYLLPFVPLLCAQDAKSAYDWYRNAYARYELLPVQRELMKTLKARA